MSRHSDKVNSPESKYTRIRSDVRLQLSGVCQEFEGVRPIAYPGFFFRGRRHFFVIFGGIHSSIIREFNMEFGGTSENFWAGGAMAPGPF